MANVAKFITIENLLENFKNFNKIILNKIYFKREKGEELEKKVSNIIGDDENISIRKLVKNMKKVSKIFLENDESLPDVNSSIVDSDSIYIVKDKNSIDEKNSYYLYTPRENKEGTKKWACISSPSNVFETTPITFESAFNRANNKFTKKVAFATFQNLTEYIVNHGKKYRYKGIDDYYCNLLSYNENDTENFEEYCFIYDNVNNILYYFNKTIDNIQPEEESNSTFKLTIQSDCVKATTLAQATQNPEGDFANGSGN